MRSQGVRAQQTDDHMLLFATTVQATQLIAEVLANFTWIFQNSLLNEKENFAARLHKSGFPRNFENKFSDFQDLFQIFSGLFPDLTFPQVKYRYGNM